jgi:hypothetical protein
MYNAFQESFDFSKSGTKAKNIGDEITRQDFEGYIENMKNVTETKKKLISFFLIILIFFISINNIELLTISLK